METKYLIILIIVAIACFSVFAYQFTSNVDTFIVINNTELSENGTITGFLMDSYARGVENKTISYHQAGDNSSELVNITTGPNGIFKIENIKNVPESGANNYYGDFSFAGDGEFNPCKYEYNLTFKS